MGGVSAVFANGHVVGGKLGGGLDFGEAAAFFFDYTVGDFTCS